MNSCVDFSQQQSLVIRQIAPIFERSTRIKNMFPENGIIKLGYGITPPMSSIHLNVTGFAIRTRDVVSVIPRSMRTGIGESLQRYVRRQKPRGARWWYGWIWTESINNSHLQVVTKVTVSAGNVLCWFYTTQTGKQANLDRMEWVGLSLHAISQWNCNVNTLGWQNRVVSSDVNPICEASWACLQNNKAAPFYGHLSAVK